MGSSPTIYPILFTKLKVQHSRPILPNPTLPSIDRLKFSWNYLLLTAVLASNELRFVANFSPTSGPTRFTYVYSILKSTTLSTQATSLNPWGTHDTPHWLKIFKKNSPTYFFSQKVVSMPFLKKTFTIFIRLNFFLSTTEFKTYSGAKQTYFSTSPRGLTLNSLGVAFKFWYTFYIFLGNVHYFKLPLLYFTNSLFRQEALALNWTYFLKFKFLWKYTQQFFYFLDNKISHRATQVFLSLRKLSFNMAFVSDVQYHKNTLHYLSRSGFYILGIVPSTNKFFFLNFIIPSASNNFISQFFFLRLLIQSKHLTSQYRYSLIRSVCL